MRTTIKRKFRVIFLISGMAVQAPAMVPTASVTTFQKPVSQLPPPPIIFPGPSTNDLQLQSRVQLEIQSQVRNFNLSRQMILSNNGEVTLEGTVASRDEYNLMERAANQVPGVTRVRNNLIITGTIQSTSGTIRP